MAAVLGVGLLLWGFSRQSGTSEFEGERSATSEAVDPATLSIYTNGEYGFSFFYPATAKAEDAFTGEPPFPWRTHASATGTPIVIIRTGGGEARVGVSAQATARFGCLIPSPSEIEAEPLTVGETTWRVFTFDALGTDDERRVTSYRTLHGDTCFAVETFEPLVSSPLPPTESPSFIIRNFTFAR